MIGKMFRRRAVDCLILLAICVLFVLVFRQAVPTALPLGYDEADYMSVARTGFWNNYAEPRSLGLISFVEIGWKTLHGEMVRGNLSDYIRGLHDPSFLRHYHGPLFSYWLVFANTLTSGDEYGTRLLGFVFHLLTFATIVLGVPWAFGETSRLAGWLGGVVYLFSLTNILTATELSTHVIFMWVSMLALILIARFAAFPTRRNYFLALAACCLAVSALEYGVLLFGCIAVAVLLRRRELLLQGNSFWRFLFASIGVALAVTLVIWPAGLLKGTLIEGVMFIGYLAKYRKGSFGTMTPLGVWEARFHGLTVDCLVEAVCLLIVAAFLWRSPRRNSLLPMFLFSALMLGTTLKNTAAAVRYFSAFPAPLITVAAVLVVERLQRVPMRALAFGIAALGCVLAVAAWRPAVRNANREDVALASLIAAIRKVPARTILVPYDFRPSISYYFPDRAVQAFVANSDRDTVARLVESGNPDMACVYGWQPLPGAVVARIVTQDGRLVCALRR